MDAKICSTFNPDFSETVAYNNPLFPAYIRNGNLSSYPDYSASSHWHDDLEFILIKKGHMTYNVNGVLIELPEDTGIMVNSRQLHYGFSAKHHECDFVCILLSPELLRANEWFYENYIESLLENTTCPFLLLSHDDWTASILEKLAHLSDIFSVSTPEDAVYFEVIEIFLSIAEILYHHLPPRKKSDTKTLTELRSLKNMINYIEQHFAMHISLSDIAASGICCKSKCSSLFKKYLHDTPISYLTKLRLRKSLSALLESDICITDIALQYGFNGASYYCEAFKNHYGISPLKYRKIHWNT